MAKKRKFPTKEAEKMSLAQDMVNGFEENPLVYPAPPTDVTAQKARITSVQKKLNAVTQAEAALKAAVQAKDAEIELMEEEMKENIEYAELTSKGDDAKLKLIGWSGRADPQKQQVPGQSRVLEILKQGAGWFQSDWKEPIDGGKVQFYKMMRREATKGGDMIEVGSSSSSEMTLVDQPRGIELEYAVIAVNKEGAGEPSNSITITL